MENKASQLFKVYVDGFAPPEWSKNILNKEEYTKSVKIYGDKEADKKEVFQLVSQREPVNIATQRAYDSEKLQKLCGYQISGYYQTIAEKKRKPANIAIYAKTPVKYQEKDYQDAHVINVIAPALDTKNQPDSRFFFDYDYDKEFESEEEFKKTAIFKTEAYKEHMQSVFDKIFQCAIDNNHKEIVLSSFGLGVFSGLCPDGAVHKGYLDGLTEYLKSFGSALNKRGIKISHNSYSGGDFSKDIKKVVNDNTEGLFGNILTGDIISLLSQKNDLKTKDRLYVNAGDPHSIVGNGNEADESLDGWWGRISAMGVLCLPYLNKNLTEAKIMEGYNALKTKLEDLGVLNENSSVEYKLQLLSHMWGRFDKLFYNKHQSVLDALDFYQIENYLGKENEIIFNKMITSIIIDSISENSIPDLSLKASYNNFVKDVDYKTKKESVHKFTNDRGTIRTKLDDLGLLNENSSVEHKFQLLCFTWGDPDKSFIDGKHKDALKGLNEHREEISRGD